MSSLIGVNDVNDTMSTYNFFIYELGCFLCGCSWYCPCFRKSGEVVNCCNNVSISLFCYRHWSDKVNSYSFPWSVWFDSVDGVIFSMYALDLTFMTLLYIFSDFVVHVWPIVETLHFCVCF